MEATPGRLTLTVTLDATYADRPAPLFGRLSPSDKDDVLAQCRALVGSMQPGYDHTREIALTDELALGAGLGEAVAQAAHEWNGWCALGRAEPGTA